MVAYHPIWDLFENSAEDNSLYLHYLDSSTTLLHNEEYSCNDGENEEISTFPWLELM